MNLTPRGLVQESSTVTPQHGAYIEKTIDDNQTVFVACSNVTVSVYVCSIIKWASTIHQFVIQLLGFSYFHNYINLNVVNIEL